MSNNQNNKNYERLYNLFKKKYKELYNADIENLENNRAAHYNSYKHKESSYLIFAILPFIICYVLLCIISISPFFLKLLNTNSNFSLVMVTIITVINIIAFFLIIGSFIWGIFSIKKYISMPKKANQKFRSDLTVTTVKRTIAKLFRNLNWTFYNNASSYAVYSAILDGDIYASGLFDNFDKRCIDDEFRGEYKGVPFNVSETKLYKYYHTKNGRRESKIFQGIIINFRINKKFHCKTIVSPKYVETAIPNKVKYRIQIVFMLLILIFAFAIIVFFPSNNDSKNWSYIFRLITAIIVFLGFIKEYNEKVKKFKNYEKVNLESYKFNEKYVVYSPDQVEARYLVTPAFMERLSNLETAFSRSSPRVSFYDGNNLMVAISTTKDLFEITGINSSITNIKDSFKQFYNEIESIYKMIEYFKLDENTKL